MYPHPKLPQGNTTVIGIAEQPNWLHVFALGVDGGLYHKYQQLNQNPAGNWTDWILRAKAPANSRWDADPVAGIDPTDGSVEVFIRYHLNLDLWQLYQTDPSNPEAWSVPRECTCFQPCNDTNPEHFWNIAPVFPTSDVTLTNNGPGGAIRLFYRGFDGGLYIVDAKPGSPHHYYPPAGLGTILE